MQAFDVHIDLIYMALNSYNLFYYRDNARINQ